MPPPVAEFSDGESTGESIPYDETEDHKDGVESMKDEDEEVEGNEGAEDEGVFIVEKILGHEFTPQGVLLLQVKWKDYDKPEDQTMEPEDALMDGAEDILKEYYKALGGRPQKPETPQLQSKKRKSAGRPKATPEKPEVKRPRRSRGADETEEATTKKPQKRPKKEPQEEVEEDSGEAEESTSTPDWMPKTKNWENQVVNVETILREGDSLVAFLNWKNNKKSKVSIELCYERCPKKMLKFYESHLVFKDS